MDLSGPHWTFTGWVVAEIAARQNLPWTRTLSVYPPLARPPATGNYSHMGELAALLLRMQAEDEVQARYEDLAERNTEGQLSPTEQEELALMVRANALLSVLKAEARAFLQHPNAA
jgi:hypothetical protein